MNNTKRNVLIIAVLGFVLLIAAYANHFNNGFHFDDEHSIVSNVYIRSLKNIPTFYVDPKMFSSDPTKWGLRPLVTTSLAIDYWLGGGLYPFYFQLSTFLWHVVLCALFFFIYRRVLKTCFSDMWANYLAIIATAWYAVHTANAETINYIISRTDVLSTVAIVSSLAIFIKWPDKRKFGFYILPALLGVFAKETIGCLIIILFFYILLFEQDLSVGQLFSLKNLKYILRTLFKIIPLIVVVIVAQYYTLSRITSIPGMSNPLLPYVRTEAYVWLHYFISFFLPLNLSADSDWKIFDNAFDERIIIGCLFVLVLVITIFRTSVKKETRPIAFGLIWFAAALLPTSLAPFAEVTNDHRMYFPFIGLMLSVVTYAGILIKRYEGKFNHILYYRSIAVVVLCILCANAYGVYQRNKVWRNEESLWFDVVNKSPENGRGLMNYGIALMDKGDYTGAEFYFKRASHLLPYYNVNYINLGIVEAFLNRPEQAEPNFKAALAYNPTDFNSYLYYAKFLQNNSRLAEAQTMAEKAVSLNPYSELALNTLMGIYNTDGKWQLLQQTAQRKLALVPGDKTALIYLTAAKDQRPAAVGNDSTPSVPKTAADYLQLSLNYYNSGMYDKCVDAANEALKLKPNYADAYNNIGAAYNKLQQWDKAIDALEKALQIDPKDKLAAGNLKFAQSQVKH